MMHDQRERRLQDLAHQIWEAEGRPEGQQERHWQMAGRLVDAELAAGRLADDEDGRDGQS